MFEGRGVSLIISDFVPNTDVPIELGLFSIQKLVLKTIKIIKISIFFNSPSVEHTPRV